MDKAIGGGRGRKREVRRCAGKRRAADAAQRAMAGVPGRLVERALSGRHLEVVRDAVDGAQRHQRDRLRQRAGQQRQHDLERDRGDAEPGAELPHPFL